MSSFFFTVWRNKAFFILLVVAIVGFFLGYKKINELENIILSRPPLAIIDTAEIASKINVGQETLAIESIKRHTNELTNAGYLVLRENAVFKSPESFVVPVDIFLADIESSDTGDLNQSILSSSYIEGNQTTTQQLNQFNQLSETQNEGVQPVNRPVEPEPTNTIIPTDGRTMEEQIEFQNELKRQFEEVQRLQQVLQNQGGF